MKRLIAFFLLLVFSFQMLPAKVLGKRICKVQMTEEVKQDCDNDSDCDDDCSKDGKSGKDEDPCKPGSMIDIGLNTDALLIAESGNITVIPWLSEELIHLYKKDIHCPPPNC